MAEPRATIFVSADTSLAEASLGELSEAIASAFRESAEQAEESGREIEKSFLDTTISMRTLEKGFNLIGEAFETFGDALVGASKLAGEHDRRIGGLIKSYEGLGRSLGKSVASSGAWKGAVEGISTAFVELQKIIASPEGQSAINSFFGSLNSFAADSLDALSGMLKLIRDIDDAFHSTGLLSRLEEASKPIPGSPLGNVAELMKIAEEEAAREKQRELLESFLVTTENLASKLRQSQGRGVEGIDRPVPGKQKDLPSGKLGTSDLQETFTAQELGISNIDILQADADAYEQLLNEVYDTKLEHMQRMADLDLQALIQDRQAADAANAVLLERKENIEFALGAVEQFAQSSVGATKAMIDQLIENLTTGTKVSGRALTLILAEAMIQQGWAFQQQAIALTFEAIANYGATAWRAAAMGSAAKTLLIAGYALKAGASSRGQGASAGAGATGGGAGGGAGGGGGGSFFGPSQPQRGREESSGRTVIVHINKPIGSPARWKRELEEILRGNGV